MPRAVGSLIRLFFSGLLFTLLGSPQNPLIMVIDLRFFEELNFKLAEPSTNSEVPHGRHTLGIEYKDMMFTEVRKMLVEVQGGAGLNQSTINSPIHATTTTPSTRSHPYSKYTSTSSHNVDLVGHYNSSLRSGFCDQRFASKFKGLLDS